MRSSTSWFKKPSFAYRERSERRSAPALAAYHWDGSTPKQDCVRDISSTGVYLLTQDRWAPGEVVSLTLQRIGPLQKAPERQIAVQAKAIRWDESGVAFSFVMPKGSDLRLWESPLKSSTQQSEPEDILREFKTAKALAFLRRICPQAITEITHTLREGLSNYRLDSAVDVALQAEEMLTFEPDTDRMLAHPQVIMRILEGGSWADADWVRQLWAGLLATACTPRAEDRSNLSHISLLSQLTTIHARIFSAACEKAVMVASGPVYISAAPITRTAAEMIQITGSRDLVRIDRDVQHLSDLELIPKRVKSQFFSVIEEANITPTCRAMELYARCKGHRGAPQEFFSSVPADASVMAYHQ
jgi:hypothetical protein